MSSLKSFGARGREMLNGGFMRPQEHSPQDLDFLINDLRFPSSDTTVTKTLGYLYHYIPYIKYKHNFKLVLASFLNNALCFGPGGAPFEENYMIIEVFKLITDKKLKISRPTLSIKAWYTIILKEVTNFVLFNPQANSWKALPIIAGMLLSNHLRDQLYTNDNPIEYRWFFREWDEKMDGLFKRCLKYTFSASQPANITDLSLISLAVTYDRQVDIREYTPQVLSHFMISRLIDLIYSINPTSAVAYTKFFSINRNDPNVETIIQSEIMQKPVVKHLNKLSFLLESYFKQLPTNEESYLLILEGLHKIHVFNKALCLSSQTSDFNKNPVSTVSTVIDQQFWFFMKNLLFSEVVVYQGILTRFLSSTTGNNTTFLSNIFAKISFNNLEIEYKEISLKILHNLYYLNQILVSIGQGGFDSYNFVYYLSLEIALNDSFSAFEFENLTRYLIGDYNEINLYPDVINNNYIVRCKVLFVLGLWENYLQQQKQNQKFIQQEIFSVCRHLVDNSKFKDFDLIEASHSVLLIYFSNDKSNKSLQEATEYVHLLIGQFPKLLSSNQLSIAIETLGKKILSSPIHYDATSLYANSVDEFLNFLHFTCMNARSGLLIEPHENADDNAFASAQPISEIAASSTISHFDKKKGGYTDIIKANKRKKPKAVVNLKLPKNHSSKYYKFERRIKPQTTREALIVSLINLVPYLPLTIFTMWLDRIWALIEMSNANEISYLTGMFWKVLSENMDLNRCEIGFRWWYENKRAAETNIYKELSLIKL